MLTISQPLSAGQAKTYHSKEFTAPEQIYWKNDGAAEGEWHGKLAEKYGLSGPVGAEEFARLADGQHPKTGEQLVHHRSVQEYQRQNGETVAPVEHRAGWDATFSAPKSVSLTALVGGDERVREAHRHAVNTALNELERYTQARIGGNHPPETTGRFIAAKFEHDAARPVDGYAAPQLHTHTVIFNVTERQDGTTRAIQPQELFRSQQFATAVYQSELFFQLRKLGYEIETGRSGAPEIKGYTQEYLEASSPRSQQIRDYLERTGYHGHGAAQIAAHATRDEKQLLPPEVALRARRELDAQFGNQADTVVARAREHEKELTKSQQQSLPPRGITAQEALTYARDRNFEREATNDGRELFRDALRRGMGEVAYHEIRANFEHRVASGEFKQIGREGDPSAHRFTTQDMIRAERYIMSRATDTENTSPQIMARHEVAAITATRPHLNESQQAAIEQILTSNHQIQGLQGAAGAGKTTTLDTIRQAAEQQGYAVEGFAPTSRAARELREAGVPADTLQNFLIRGSNTTSYPEKHLYILDESSLASTAQIRRFLDRIQPEDKVLLVGDTRQHQAVDAGKPFEQLQQAGMHTAQLDRIIRQKEPQLLQAVEHLAKNDTATAVSMLREQGRVHQVPNTQERIEAIAKSYVAQPDRAIIVSPDNASRKEINQAVRSELQSAGLLSKDDHSMRILTPRSELTAADRTWAARYRPGDVLYYTRGSKQLDIEKRTYAQVTAVDPRNNLLTVRKPDGNEVTYDPSRLRGITAYQESERQFAAGDRIQFTAPNRALGVANRDLGTIERIHDGGQVKVRLKEGKAVTFDPGKMRHFDHGYAVTSHSAQGLTTERVLINIDGNSHKDLVNTRLAYVAISRASHDAQIFTDNAPLLAANLSHQVTKTSAIELDRHHFPWSHTTKTPGSPTPQHSPETAGSHQHSQDSGQNVTGSSANQQNQQQQTRLEQNLGLSI